jgi:hypothetical protein
MVEQTMKRGRAGISELTRKKVGECRTYNHLFQNYREQLSDFYKSSKI